MLDMVHQQRSNHTTMEWKDIEQNIRRQVENGTYMGANEAYLVDEVERGRIAKPFSFSFSVMVWEK